MNNLPPAIALAIVNNVNKNDLYTLILVNRQFNTVTNPLLWRSIELKRKDRLIQLVQSALPSRHRLFDHVRCFTIALDDDLGDDLDDMSLLSLIPLLPPSLEELTLHGVKLITHASFNYLPQRCPHLKSLTLNNTSISYRSLLSVGQHCHQLRSLSLLYCENLPPNVFAAFAGCPLETVHLDRFDTINDDEHDNDHNTRSLQTMTHDLVVGFPLLTSLTMDRFDGRAFVATMDDATPRWPNLTRFVVENTSKTKNRDVMAFIQAHPHLKDLEFIDNRFSNKVLRVIADCLPGLTRLNLAGGEGFTHLGVRRIVEQCPLLVSLDLSQTYVEAMSFPELDFLEYDYYPRLHDNYFTVMSDWRQLCGIEMETCRRLLLHSNNYSDNDDSDDSDGSDDSDDSYDSDDTNASDA